MDEAKKKLLLVDDCEVTLLVEKVLLESRGYEVQTVSELSAFEDAVAAFQPDVVLTDIQMPEASGVELCRRLKQTSRQLPVVLVSSMDEVELHALAQQAGADGSISKAEGMEALGEKMDALVRMLWMMG
ncbi:MAG: response regulator [Deltaproteobacteria bacterium]|nr:response regulator [Deltaproteobacteria bacterium]